MKYTIKHRSVDTARLTAGPSNQCRPHRQFYVRFQKTINGCSQTNGWRHAGCIFAVNTFCIINTFKSIMFLCFSFNCILTEKENLSVIVCFFEKRLTCDITSLPSHIQTPTDITQIKRMFLFVRTKCGSNWTGGHFGCQHFKLRSLKIQRRFKSQCFVARLYEFARTCTFFVLHFESALTHGVFPPTLIQRS